MDDETTINITTGETTEEVPLVSCPECKNNTKHSVLASVELTGSHPAIDWRDVYQVVQCRGCETLSFRKVHTNSEDWDGYYEPDGTPVQVANERVELYPSRETSREPIDDVDLLPTKIRTIYSETLQALDSNQPVLAGVGIRAIVETICKDANSTGANLAEKIDGLIKVGKLTPDGAAALHRLRVLGNASAHDVLPHSSEQLGLGLDVVEHVLIDLYVLPRRVHDAFGDA
jgi:hypothetical protein